MNSATSAAPAKGTMTAREMGSIGGKKRAAAIGHEGFVALGLKGGGTVSRLIRKGKVYEILETMAKANRELRSMMDAAEQQFDA